MSRGARRLLSGAAAIVFTIAAVWGVTWVQQNWDCTWRVGNNPLYGMPEDSAMVDINGDGEVDDADYAAVGNLPVRMATNMRYLYKQNTGWGCIAHPFSGTPHS
jgi:hypothetical protein